MQIPLRYICTGYLQRWADYIFQGIAYVQTSLTRGFVFVCTSNIAMAPCPLLDLMEYQGKTYSLARDTDPPSSPKVSAWISGLPWSSAPGQGRAVYRVDGDKVFLVKFRGCESELSDSGAHEQSESKMLASWLTEKLMSRLAIAMVDGILQKSLSLQEAVNLLSS